ncbi:MAG: GatB/YqeY domain-containing protein [Candidatus Nealsonbacteria bacterium]|nr:GatB/YqeY domain-containing protein [Candidatus Nealsonbacteria bacterium]
MSFKEKIQQDLIEALKAKKELKTSVLRMLLASILNKEKDKRYKLKENQDTLLTDEEILEVVSLEAKKRKEAAELYEKGGRSELAAKEKSELEILQKYLPEQLSADEIKKLVIQAVAKSGAKEQKDMGKVMVILMPQVKGRANGNLVSQIVKESLHG